MFINKLKKLTIGLFCFSGLSFAFAANLQLSVVSKILTNFAQSDFHWQCEPATEKLLTKTGSVKWLQLNCSGRYPYLLLAKAGQSINTLKINVVDSNMADSHLYLMPVIAQQGNPLNPYRQSILEMGHANLNLLAGINGGYFFENRINSTHKDNNCFSKKSPQYTTFGVGDGLLIINNKTYSTNCAPSTFLSNQSRSVIFQNEKSEWEIDRIPPGVSPAHIPNALGAGPGLIESVGGVPKIAIRWEGIVSTFEFSANTAVAIAKDQQGKQHIIFFTVDGVDKKQGMYASEMANFIYYKLPLLLNLKIVSAISMDQGGSTTMYVRAANPQVVTHSNRNPNAVRTVYDALFVGEK